MNVYTRRADEVATGVWLIGIGLLFYTGYWWPGILFVAGAGTAVHAMIESRSWYAAQGSLWMIGLGAWFASGAKLWVLLVAVGASIALLALFRPPFLDRKPYVDNTLE